MYSQNYFRKDLLRLLFNMQGYEDGPPGDEYYSRACGKNGGAHRHFPQLPPGWAPVVSQHTAPTKVKLPPFWTRDSRSRFTLAESTFHRSGIDDTRLRFDLVLPALPEEVIDQLRGILHAVDDIADPHSWAQLPLIR